jgi:two-component system, chemotaxis family, sensor histidine kinase and response regulator WspE
MSSAPDSLLGLFQVEAGSQTALLNQRLLDLERTPQDSTVIEALMRAAHSLKGAARIVGLATAVELTHAMEDYFVAAQRRNITPNREHIDALLSSADTLAHLARVPEGEINHWLESHKTEFKERSSALRTLCSRPEATPRIPSEDERTTPDLTQAAQSSKLTLVQNTPTEIDERMVRIDAAKLERLIALAGEMVVESRGLSSFISALSRLKRQQTELHRALDSLHNAVLEKQSDGHVEAILQQLQRKATVSRAHLSAQLIGLDDYERRHAALFRQLYKEATTTRMSPLAEGVQGFDRIVRDVACSSGKKARLEITGLATPVDRDILEKLRGPLNQLLCNAVVHGIEPPQQRLAAGKPEEGMVQLAARHHFGMLQVRVSDDGQGIDLGILRQELVDKQFTTADMAARMTEEELLEFLYLPGFTMKKQATETAGRGVGLNIVANTVRAVGGSIKITSEPGQGMHFQLQLPLTLSVIRGLFVQIAGEPYVFPLTRIESTLTLGKADIFSLQGRDYFTLGRETVGLVAAYQVLGLPPPPENQAQLSVVVLGDRRNRFGIVVDRILGERSLLVQPLDMRLGKVRDVSAATLMDDGTPALIVDVDDLVRSIDNLVASGRLTPMERADGARTSGGHKRILVVDDSFTVREVERKLLEAAGYQVEVAVDGMEGWNAVRTGNYDLVISDVDMPRLTGIELVTLIKQNPVLRSLPIMIVSYKDREEDRRQGLEAGADYYLTKGSFHDETLLEAVVDLIGEARR